ncbi:MAG: PUA domain-containing protein [Candidatus Ranarchaeia archaeon]|jgi:archaeosine-15-forming tRNA-guanine transglycosylase
MKHIMSLKDRAKQIATYQFGMDIADIIIPEDAEIRTNSAGKIRYVFHDGKHCATLRSTTGRFTLSKYGVRNLPTHLIRAFPLTLVILPEIEIDFKPGMSLFAKHVKSAKHSIRPGDEVLVINTDDKIMCTGRAILSGREIENAKDGIAVRTRN